MSKYMIALIAAYASDEGYQVLQVYGPLDSKENADRLAGYMDARIGLLNKSYQEETGYEVVVNVWSLEHVKVRHAVKVAQALFDEVMGEAALDSDQVVIVPREEIIYSPLLNDPVDA